MLEPCAQAFSEDVYYCAQEYGPEDVRTSLGYYNLSKVFQSRGQMAKSLAFNDMVMHIWSSALYTLVLGEEPRTHIKQREQLPMGRSQLLEVVAMLQVCGKMTRRAPLSERFVLVNPLGCDSPAAGHLPAAQAGAGPRGAHGGRHALHVGASAAAHRGARACLRWTPTRGLLRVSYRPTADLRLTETHGEAT